MRRIAGYGIVVCLLLVPVLAAAQEEEGNIAQIVFFSAKPGMEEQMEEGIKRHMNWHREQNDPWAWIVWEYITGDKVGTYGAGTFDHHWADFDTAPVPREADEADVAVNVAPYANFDSVRFYAYLGDVSHPAAENAPMSVLVEFQVRQGMADEFEYAIGKFHEAIQKTSWPVHYTWWALVNGGRQPMFALVLPRANFAAFKPQEKPFAAMLEEAYGRTEAQALLDAFGETVKSQNSSASRVVPEFSYIPEGN